MDVTDCTLIDLATREATDRFEDGIWGEPEEVEVAGLPLNVSARDQRGAAGEREPVCLGEAGDDLGDLLQRAEPLRWAAVFLDPRCPRLSDRGRNDEFVPELEQGVGIDIEAHGRANTAMRRGRDHKRDARRRRHHDRPSCWSRCALIESMCAWLSIHALACRDGGDVAAAIGPWVLRIARSMPAKTRRWSG